MTEDDGFFESLSTNMINGIPMTEEVVRGFTEVGWELQEEQDEFMAGAHTKAYMPQFGLKSLFIFLLLIYKRKYIHPMGNRTMVVSSMAKSSILFLFETKQSPFSLNQIGRLEPWMWIIICNGPNKYLSSWMNKILSPPRIFSEIFV